ncbi:MAG: hypothetical protein M1814_006245 [Vezdaea aestivalis]|nr:MAG: hypothetical protein M1814_006245 [Vezdaea aestivalis]
MKRPSRLLPTQPLASDPSSVPRSLTWADISSNPSDEKPITSHPDYGLDVRQNIQLLSAAKAKDNDDATQEQLESLLAAWTWVGDMKTASQHASFSPFSYIGIYPLWSTTDPSSPTLRLLSTPSPSDLLPAISSLLTTYSLPTYPAHPTAVPSAHPLHRALCLALNQTAFTSPSLAIHISSLPPTRGALYAYIHSDRALAISTLQASPSHSALAIALSAPSSTPAFSATLSIAATHSADPYTSALLSHLSTTSWSHLLNHSRIPLRDKLLVALTTLSDSALTAYLLTLLTPSSNPLSALPLHGMTPSLLPALLHHTLQTSDLATPTLLLDLSPLSHTPFSKFLSTLHKTHLLHTSLHALALYTSHSPTTSKAQTHLTLRCPKCPTPLSQPHAAPRAPPPPIPALLARTSTAATTASASTARSSAKRSARSLRQARCPSCGASWPRCAVCRRSLGGAGGALDRTGGNEVEAEGLMHCLECGHGLHAGCGREWFSGGRVGCAVAECGCECAS